MLGRQTAKQGNLKTNMEKLEIIGLNFAELQEKLPGRRCRVVMEDGKPLFLTMDYIAGRVNLYVTNGKITGYKIE